MTNLYCFFCQRKLNPDDDGNAECGKCLKKNPKLKQVMHSNLNVTIYLCDDEIINISFIFNISSYKITYYQNYNMMFTYQTNKISSNINDLISEISHQIERRKDLVAFK